MDIIGTVIAVNKSSATVAVKRPTACGENCAQCHGGCQATTMTATAENVAGAKVGDTVKIETESRALIRAAIVLYLVPVVVTILIAALTYGSGMSNLYVMLLSVIAFFASFFIIKCFDKNLAPKSYITKILGKGVN